MTLSSLKRPVKKILRLFKNRILKPVRRVMPVILKPKYFYEQEKLGVSRSEIERLKDHSNSFGTSVLFGKEIKIASNFWYLHSLKELFIDEVYKFKSKSKSPVIIDCGANVGLSVIYFKRLFPAAKIIAFEPDSQNFDIINFNLKQFGFKDVDVRNEAVWKETSTLHFSATGNIGGKLDFTSSSNSDKVIEVNAVRLRDFLQQKVDFLKIDIEGAECDVLKDCADLLINVDNLFVEYHSEPGTEQKIDNLLLILKTAGFRTYIQEAWDNLPHPFLRNDYKPCFDMQLNISAYRI